MTWKQLSVLTFSLALSSSFVLTETPASESSDNLAEITSANLVSAALDRTNHHVIYEGSYRKIDYPMGDVPENIGVCTDVVVRSYRKLGLDLQQLVHEDMKANFAQYPKNWGLKRPDTNIDHRRVPNLERFFERHGQTLAITDDAKDYLPGDIVSWRLAGGLPHIGIVSNKKSAKSDNYMIVHNIGLGPKLEDVLFDYRIVGHYRYLPPAEETDAQ
ncbi:DUF1287 domain-containing protein [Kangiella spongicola]|uniref:DUF1287 domain-containing protein n=1 Tax=Kangiella spongicola TaxID=796379 RepID=A0A318D2J5_9GAMM|nr:DUF1287 domain-containing protein [Kangiella spongicola]PXF63191.1 DUF1287 domain-containing protein [Kangiella spongicola]